MNTLKMTMGYLVFILVCYAGIVGGEKKVTDQAQAQLAVDQYNKKGQQVFTETIQAIWTYYANLTDDNQKKMVAQNLVMSDFKKENAQKMSTFDTSKFPDVLKRQIKVLKNIGPDAEKNKTILQRLGKVIAEMSVIHSTAKSCITPTNCVPLNPDLVNLTATSRDANLLRKAWVAFRDATGKKMKDLYEEYVKLSNKAVASSGYSDLGEFWRSAFEMDNFEAEMKKLMDEIMPLYEQLHAYVRRKLIAIYGKGIFPSTGQIPAHILGDVHAFYWRTLIKDIAPFKDKSSMDVTDEMVKQGYDVTRMYKAANNFFKSLGLIEMPKEFWDKSLLEKPNDGRDVLCHGSAWDFYNGKDFRILMCTNVNQDDFEVVHHEMGHIEYFLLYKHLPLMYRGGANPGFHEAIGDVMSLSVGTPEHMHSIGLLKDLRNDNETDINFLMNMALQKIAFLPFGYLIDHWRWGVFRGETKPDDYNKHWWDLRCKYQGVSPPVERTSSDFDAGSLFHVGANVPYVRYFVSYIIQFQFHKALCEAAGSSKPLHRCDIYNSKAAGKALGDMLKLGSSKPWPDAMEQLTGQRKISIKPLMEYFDPLLKFLKKENGNDVGWKAECPDLSLGTLAVPSVTLTAILTILSLVFHLYH